jgi:hypothetical protein
MDIEYYDIIVKSFAAGVLSAYLLIYGLRPSVMYPDIVLEFFENQWMFLVLLLVNYYVFIWDNLCGALLLLCIIALIFDYAVFTDRIKKTQTVVPISQMNQYNQVNPVPTFEPIVNSTVDIVSGNFQENMMNQWSKHQHKDSIYNLQGAPSPFI